jgi:hypothetical protein
MGGQTFVERFGDRRFGWRQGVQAGGLWFEISRDSDSLKRYLRDGVVSDLHPL